MRVMQEEHQRTTEMLQHQVEHAQLELARLQNVQSRKSPSDHEHAEGIIEFVRDPRQEERESGEVSTAVGIYLIFI